VAYASPAVSGFQARAVSFSNVNYELQTGDSFLDILSGNIRTYFTNDRDLMIDQGD